jgi:hypothetical protein
MEGIYIFWRKYSLPHTHIFITLYIQNIFKNWNASHEECCSFPDKEKTIYELIFLFYHKKIHFSMFSLSHLIVFPSMN